MRKSKLFKLRPQPMPRPWHPSRAAQSVDAALRAALLVASALASGYQLGREIAVTAT
jgi:hypothetical protein